MNICLAAFAKDRDDIDAFRQLFRSARSYLQDVFPEAKDTGRRFIRDQVAIYNTNQMASAWSVPVWLQTPRTIVSASAPPVPRSQPVAASEYADHMVDATNEPDWPAAFNPGFFAAAIDIRTQRLRVWSDLIGLGRCYYVDDARFFAASNSLAALTFFRHGGLEVDETSWRAFAGLGKFVRDRTPYVGVSRLPPATVVTCDAGGVHHASYDDYGALVRPRADRPDYQGVAEELRTVAQNAAQMMMHTPKVDLSGGKDSRLTAAAWIASGAPSSVMTVGTLRQEVVVAERLMELAAKSIDLAAQGVLHTVVTPTRAHLRQSLAERIGNCMRVWDGDYPPIRMMKDVNPDAMGVGVASLSGGGGELAHNGFYHTARQLEQIEAASRPMDRLITHFTTTPPVPTIPDEGRQLIAEQLYEVEDEGRAYGITGPTLVDYYHLRERFRRWVAAGHATSNLVLFASPAFVRLAFDVSPSDRLQLLIHRRLTNAFIPGWGDVGYYRSAPSAVDERAEQGLRLWQGDTRDLLFDTIASGTAYRPFWDREGLLDLALRVARGLTENRNEAVFQRVLWFEGFSQHAKKLSRRVRLAQQRAFAAGSSAD